MSARLSEAGTRQIRGLRERLEALDRLRETLGYKATLRRGYAVVRGDGAVVTTREAAAEAQALEVEFADGRLALDGSGAEPRKRAKPASPPKSPPEGQGSLF